jgi:hypothetical protein
MSRLGVAIVWFGWYIYQGSRWWVSWATSGGYRVRYLILKERKTEVDLAQIPRLQTRVRKTMMPCREEALAWLSTASPTPGPGDQLQYDVIRARVGHISSARHRQHLSRVRPGSLVRLARGPCRVTMSCRWFALQPGTGRDSVYRTGEWYITPALRDRVYAIEGWKLSPRVEGDICRAPVEISGTDKGSDHQRV